MEDTAQFLYEDRRGKTFQVIVDTERELLDGDFTLTGDGRILAADLRELKPEDNGYDRVKAAIEMAMPA